MEVGGINGDEGIKSILRVDILDVRRIGEYKCEVCNIGNCIVNVIEVFIDGKYWNLVYKNSWIV